jgi:hypothetical protein
MREIAQRAAQVAARGERYRPFAEELGRLAKTYQSQAILALVERCLDENAPRNPSAAAAGVQP